MDGDLTCTSCRHFIDSAEALESMWPGLTIVSSAAGSSRGDCGVCAVRDVFMPPEPACERFAGRGEPGDGRP
jgi:hypothetical protein